MHIFHARHDIHSLSLIGLDSAAAWQSVKYITHHMVGLELDGSFRMRTIYFEETTFSRFSDTGVAGPQNCFLKTVAISALILDVFSNAMGYGVVVFHAKQCSSLDTSKRALVLFLVSYCVCSKCDG